MTFSRGIRGAITVDENSVSSISEATVELLNKMINANSIESKDISHVIFSVTKDLNAAFPAKFARDIIGWSDVPMMCFNEADIDDSLLKCLRVLIVINSEKPQSQIKHIYLKEAKCLRPDISL